VLIIVFAVEFTSLNCLSDKQLTINY